MYKMGLLQYIYKNEDLRKIDNNTLNIIKNFLKENENEFRINVDEYFKSKNFSNETIRLYSGIIYDAHEPLNFTLKKGYTDFKSGGGTKYNTIVCTILAILKEYYGNTLTYNTDGDNIDWNYAKINLEKLKYEIKLENNNNEHIGGMYEVFCHKTI